MANTYTQIYMHVIFAVKGRESLIRPEWQDELYRYMAGALKNHEHTPYMAYGFIPSSHRNGWLPVFYADGIHIHKLQEVLG